MPDYDLGSAHGKVQVDGDASGVEAVNQKLDQFKRALTDIVGRIGAFQAGMDRIEAELKAVKSDFNNATQAADQYNRTLTIVHVSSQNSSRSTLQLAQDIKSTAQQFYAAADAAAKYGKPLSQLVSFGNQFRKSSGDIAGFASALQKSGIASSVLSIMAARFLGIGAAIAGMPEWQRKVLAFSNSVRVLTLIAGPIGIAGAFMAKNFKAIADSGGLAGAVFTRLSALLKPLGETLGGIGSRVGGFLKSINDIPKGMGQAVLGLAVLKGGLSGLAAPITGLIGLINKLPLLWKAALAALSIAGPGLFEGLAAGLRLTSNLIVGVVSAAKDLSGGLLAIPGAFAIIGAAAVPLVGILFTLKSQFSSLFKDVNANDMQKATEDLAKMPGYLRPLGQTIVDIIPKWKALGDAFTSTFTAGLSDQLAKISDTYLPALKDGGVAVAGGLKEAKDSFVAFLSQAQTVTDVNTLFGNTTGVLHAVAQAVAPISSALRDIGVVGSTFIRQLAEIYLPVIAQQFANWAKNARDTGALMGWMEQSVHAAVELGKGIGQAVEATYRLLTVFKTGSGANFLDNFATSMKKFNDEVKNSEANGVLRQIGDSVRNIGLDKFHELIDTVKSLLPAIGEALVFIGKFGESLSATFGPVLKVAAAAVAAFLAGLNALGGGAVIGTILGIGAAFKLLLFAFGPVTNGIKIIVGAFNLMKGLDRVVAGLGVALEGMGTTGKAAADKLATGFAAVRSAISVAAGVITAAIIGFTLYEQGMDEIRNGQKALQDSTKHTQESIENLRDALHDDHGVSGENVFNAIRQSVDTAMSDLDTKISAAPGLLGKLTDLLKEGNVSGHPGFIDLSKGWSDTVHQLDDTRDAAKSTQAAFLKLGISNKDLTQILANGGSDYDALISKLKALGTEGQPAIEFAQKLKDLIGESGVQSAAGHLGQYATQVIEITRATGNWFDANETLAESLAKIGIQADQAGAAIQGSTTDFDKFLKTLGEKKASEALVDTVKTLRDQFENGGQQIKQFSDAIEKMNDVTATADEKATAFIASLKQLGTLPDDEPMQKYQEDVDNAIGYQSKLLDLLDKTGDALVLQSGRFDQSSKNGRELSQTVQGIVSANAALVLSGQASPEEAFSHTTEVLKKLLIDKAQLDPDTAQKVINTYFPASAFKNAIAAQNPIQAINDVYAKDGPAKIAAELNLLTSTNDVVNQIVGPDGKLHVPTVLDPSMAAAQRPDNSGFDTDADNLGWSDNAPSAAPPAPSPVLPPGFGAGGPDLSNLDPTKVLQVLGDNPDIAQTLQPILDQASKQGQNFSDAFAAGIQDGSPAVKDAIIKLAQLAGDGLGHSPALYGPLSGDGWTFNRGQAFSTDWAGGISSASGVVKNAVKDAAYGAVTGMQEPNNTFKQLADLNSFAGKFIEVARQITDVFLQLGKIGNIFTSGALSPKRYIPDKTAPARLGQGNPLGTWTPKGWTPPTGVDGQTPTGGTAPITVNPDGTVSSTNPEWQHLLTRESGGRNVQTPGNPAMGYFQIEQGTWDSHGGQKFAKTPLLATPEQQAQVAASILQANPSGSDWGAGMPGREDASKLVAGLSGGTVPISQMPVAAGGPTSGTTSALDGINLSTIPVAAQKYANDCIDASARIILSHSGINLSEEAVMGKITAGGTITSQAAGLNALNAAGKYVAMEGSGGSPQALFDAIKTSIDQGVGSILNVAPGSSIAGRNFSEGHFIAATGYNPDGTINLSDTARGTRYPVSAADAFQATRNRGIVAGTGTGPPPIGPGGGSNAPIPVNIAQQGGVNVPAPGAIPTTGPPLSPGGQVIATNKKSGAQVGLDPAFYQANKADWDLSGVSAPGAPPTPPPITPLGAPGATPNNPVNVALPNADSNALATTADNTDGLGDLSQQGQVSQKLQDIGVPSNITNQDQAVTALQSIDVEITKQNQLQTPQGKQMAQALGQVHSDLQQQFGLKEAPSALDAASTVASSVGGIASDVIGDISAGIDAVGAAKNIGDMFVRGIASTNDIIGLLDNAQKFITFAAKIAGTVGDVAGAIGSIASAAGGASGMPGGGSAGAAIQGIQAIAQVVQSALEAVNATIQLGEQAWQIFGSYFGGFLGMLAGGAGGLMGNVKFLLDENTGQLLSYSSDNPLKKNALPIPGAVVNPNADNQGIGQLNYYAGPGQDPRDSTRQMMYQVKAAQMNTVTAQ